MKIAILTHYDDAFKQISDVVMPHWRNYAKKNDYTFIEVTNNHPSRHIVWAKIHHILNHINDYDYILYVDADTLVTNLSFSLESLIEENPDKDLFISNDINGLNSGVFLIKNSDMGKCFLNETWDSFPCDMILCEQSAMSDQIARAPQLKVKFVKQKILNAYKYELYNLNYPDGQWDSDSFLLHLPGTPNDKRVKIFSKEVDKYAK